MAYPKMLTKMLTHNRIRGELRHLLCRPPFLNMGISDPGWMCREHAFLVAALSALLGFKSVMCWGSLCLVGKDENGEGNSFQISQHSWAMVEGAGLYDLSVNTRPIAGPEWVQWPEGCFVEWNYHPHHSVRLEYFSSGENVKWTRAIDQNLSSRSLAGIYLGSTYDDFDRNLIEIAIDAINSPLTDDLKKLVDFDSEIYAKAVQHLWELSKLRTRSLHNLSQIDSWRQISRRPRGANNWLHHEIENLRS